MDSSPRLSPIPESELSEAQRRVRDGIASGPRGGVRGVVDLIGTCGYYGTVSMVLNAARVPMPEGVSPSLKV